MALDYKLNRPVTFEGQTYETLSLDFDAMTGRDVARAKQEYEASRIGSLGPKAVLAMDSEFAAYFAARAARVHVGVLDHVSAPDYVAITQAAINFLLFSGFLRDDFKEMKVAKETVEAEMEMTSEQTSTT